LAVSFASATPAVCSSTAGGVVTLLATGLCTITASQPGDAAFAAAVPVSRSFTVIAALQSQTIVFGLLIERTLGSPPFNLGASASSGLPVTFASLTTAVCSVAGSTVTLLSIGICTMAADQPGNAMYAAAPQVLQSFQVVPAAGGGGSPDGDIPTLPDWAALLMGLTLLALALRRHAGRSPSNSL